MEAEVEAEVESVEAVEAKADLARAALDAGAKASLCSLVVNQPKNTIYSGFRAIFHYI